MAAKKEFDIIPPGEQERKHGVEAATNTLNPGRPQTAERKQLGIRIPKADFEDLESLRMMWSLERNGRVMNDELTNVIHEFIQNYRAEIDKFRQTISSYDKR